MNPKRRFRQLRSDDRWVGLPPTRSQTQIRAHRAGETRPRNAVATTVVAFVIAGVVAIGLWAGLSGVLHRTEPASLSPLPSTTLQPRPRISTPCTESDRLAPIGCSTYTAIAAAGVPGGTDTWAGALPPSLTLRVLNGKVTALISSGCNGITLPVTLSANTMNASGPANRTAMLCGGARGVQERWVSALFRDTINYTLNGSNLRLTAGPKVLELTATPTTATTPSASATPTRGATPTNSFAALPSPAPAPTRSAVRHAFGQGCTSTTAAMPSTKFRATIGDVDGDGRPDTEWALIGTRGLVWGVTTAAGATIEETDAFASGGSRSVSIGTLATGQTIALPSDGHTDALRVLHDCRWVTPEASGEKGAFNFISAYGSPVESAIGSGGECIGGRLYQVFTDESAAPNQQTAVPETVADGGGTVTTAHTRLRLTPASSTSSNGAPTYGEQCLPSNVLMPVYKK